VGYYELNVYDENWNRIPFATADRLMQVGYLQTKTFEVYVRDSDIEKIEFICTTSRQLKDDVKSTGITSKICSRVK
jgi:hypothetical protein